jgi:Na+/phosphate symporter
VTAKNFFYCQAILNISFGLGLLFTPQMLLDMYGAQTTNVSGMFDVIARSYGTLLTSLGITAFLMRDAKPSLARYVYLMGTAIAGFLITVVTLKAIFQGVENNLSWLVVLSTSIIMFWSGYLVSKEDKKTLE